MKNEYNLQKLLLHLVVLTLLIVFLTNCAYKIQLYSGPIKDKSATCKLTTDELTIVQKFDDFNSPLKKFQEFTFLPGNHTILVRHLNENSTYTEPYELNFTSVPSKNYYLNTTFYNCEGVTFTTSYCKWQPYIIQQEPDSNIQYIQYIEGIDYKQSGIINELNDSTGVICVFNPDKNPNPLNLPNSMLRYKPKVITINNTENLNYSASDYSIAKFIYVNKGINVINEKYKLFSWVFNSIIKIDVKPGRIYFVRWYHNNVWSITPAYPNEAIFQLKNCKIE